jgi:hypothetical protein
MVIELFSALNLNKPETVRFRYHIQLIQFGHFLPKPGKSYRAVSFIYIGSNFFSTTSQGIGS